MVPNPTLATFFLTILGVLTFVLIMFLPTLFELKRPKDAGPRIIMNNTLFMQEITRNNLLLNIEEEQRFDQAIINRIVRTIYILPNLEA